MALLTRRRYDGLRLLAVAVAAAVVLSGCGTPPELYEGSSSRGSSAATGVPSPTAPPTLVPPTAAAPPGAVPPPPTASATPPSSAAATACPSGPSAGRIIRLVRGTATVLPPGTSARVKTGPLCADGWQYTVLAVRGYEDLLVVTRGRSDAPTLVTAGTDVCTIEVRTAAPAGIRTVACDGTVGVPGA